MKGLTLTQREQTRLQVLNQLVGHQMTAPEAAVVLGLSERHTWRMLAAYREEGAAAWPPLTATWQAIHPMAAGNQIPRPITWAKV